jgi:peptide/nickel transport system ATP-binding protein
MNPPKGCPFCTRCPRKIGSICETDIPPLHHISDTHKILCHIELEELQKMEPVIVLAGDAAE